MSRIKTALGILLPCWVIISLDRRISLANITDLKMPVEACDTCGIVIDFFASRFTYPAKKRSLAILMVRTQIPALDSGRSKYADPNDQKIVRA